MALPLQSSSSWESLYQSSAFSSLPWYSEKLDFDLAQELRERKLAEGSFLDLGAGPSTQAMLLTRLGFHVTAADISTTAMKKAKAEAEKQGIRNITFLADDITHSSLKPSQFNFILDRGCFHTLEPSDRITYIKTVNALLKENGLLFLKCFSHHETMINGPHRFSTEEIKDLFSKEFIIESIHHTHFEGTLAPIQKRSSA